MLDEIEISYDQFKHGRVEKTLCSPYYVSQCSAVQLYTQYIGAFGNVNKMEKKSNRKIFKRKQVSNLSTLEINQMHLWFVCVSISQ